MAQRDSDPPELWAKNLPGQIDSWKDQEERFAPMPGQLLRSNAIKGQTGTTRLSPIETQPVCLDGAVPSLVCSMSAAVLVKSDIGSSTR